MRRILRKKLGSGTVTYLHKQTKLIRAAPRVERKGLAKKLWKQAKDTKAFKEIRGKLRRMAKGLRRCMYCEDSRGVAIDHFFPLALYPKKAFTWQNYLYACTYCNSNKKRDQFPIDPVTRRPLLVKPTKEDPRAHFVLTPSTGRFVAGSSSSKGAPTIRVFGLNTRPELVTGRRDAFTALQSLLIDYAGQRRAGLDDQASKIEQAVRHHPFSTVFVYLIQIAGSPGASSLLRPACLAAIHMYPEIKTWV